MIINKKGCTNAMKIPIINPNTYVKQSKPLDLAQFISEISNYIEVVNYLNTEDNANDVIMEHEEIEDKRIPIDVYEYSENVRRGTSAHIKVINTHVTKKINGSIYKEIVPSSVSETRRIDCVNVLTLMFPLSYSAETLLTSGSPIGIPFVLKQLYSQSQLRQLSVDKRNDIEEMRNRQDNLLQEMAKLLTEYIPETTYRFSDIDQNSYPPSINYMLNTGIIEKAKLQERYDSSTDTVLNLSNGTVESLTERLTINNYTEEELKTVNFLLNPECFITSLNHTNSKEIVQSLIYPNLYVTEESNRGNICFGENRSSLAIKSEQTTNMSKAMHNYLSLFYDGITNRDLSRTNITISNLLNFYKKCKMNLKDKYRTNQIPTEELPFYSKSLAIIECQINLVENLIDFVDYDVYGAINQKLEQYNTPQKTKFDVIHVPINVYFIEFISSITYTPQDSLHD